MSVMAILMMTLSGCAAGVSGEAVCDGTRTARSAHAAALVVDGGPQSRSTGRALIARLDAGCGQ
jgi:hypothetical protein